jgi:mRNA interferase MazF
MAVGDIHWIEFPAANGHEQTGRRPAIVLQDDEYAGSSPLVLVVPLTGAASVARFPGAVPVKATPTNGLRQDSVVLVFQIRAADRRRIREKIGAISAEVLAAIHQALDRLTGRSGS